MYHSTCVWIAYAQLIEITVRVRSRILAQVTIYRRLLIGRDSHLDQSEAYDISLLVREYGPGFLISYFFNTTCTRKIHQMCS